MPNPAAFQFSNYTFPHAELNMGNLEPDKEIDLSFNPKGEYDTKEHTFTLMLEFKAEHSETRKPVVHVSCEAQFLFRDPISLEEIPPFFFANSIAIVFPYIRAFVSTLTLQANITPLVLPTMNLSSLQETLKENITILQ